MADYGQVSDSENPDIYPL